MEAPQHYSVKQLKVHHRNKEYYDGITGTEYEQLKASIQNEGVLKPIIVTPDKTVINGHQRLRACRELQLEMVPIITRQDVTTEDEKLVALVAADYGRLKSGEVLKPPREHIAVKPSDNNYVNPTCADFQRIIEENGYVDRCNIIRQFDEYDCREARALLQKVASRDDSPYVRQAAYQKCSRLGIARNSYKKAPSIEHHRCFTTIKKHIKVILKELKITDIEQLKKKRLGQFFRIFTELYPKEYDFIEGHYGYNLDDERKEFFIKVCDKIFKEEEKNIAAAKKTERKSRRQATTQTNQNG